MTQEEKDLALRIFEKAMEDKQNLNEHQLYARLSVEASKSIYSAIRTIEEQEFEEEEIAIQKRLDEETKIREQNKAIRMAAKENADHYIVYKKRVEYGRNFTSVRIMSSTQTVDKVLGGIFSKWYAPKIKEFGIRKISKDDAEKMLYCYRSIRSGASKNLKCETVDDFLRYVGECKCVSPVDVSKYSGEANVF